MQALNRAWQYLPPVAVSLRRVSAYLGLDVAQTALPPARSSQPDEAMRQAQSAGIPVMHGRPDDPMLAFLDP